jgi:hypothetical protein
VQISKTVWAQAWKNRAEIYLSPFVSNALLKHESNSYFPTFNNLSAQLSNASSNTELTQILARVTVTTTVLFVFRVNATLFLILQLRSEMGHVSIPQPVQTLGAKKKHSQHPVQ